MHHTIKKLVAKQSQALAQESNDNEVAVRVSCSNNVITLKAFFLHHDSAKLQVLMGDAGMGKSYFAKQHVCEKTRQWQQGAIPLYIDLRFNEIVFSVALLNQLRAYGLNDDEVAFLEENETFEIYFDHYDARSQIASRVDTEFSRWSIARTYICARTSDFFSQDVAKHFEEYSLSRSVWCCHPLDSDLIDLNIPKPLRSMIHSPLMMKLFLDNQLFLYKESEARHALLEAWIDYQANRLPDISDTAANDATWLYLKGMSRRLRELNETHVDMSCSIFMSLSGDDAVVKQWLRFMSTEQECQTVKFCTPFHSDGTKRLGLLDEASRNMLQSLDFPVPGESLPGFINGFEGAELLCRSLGLQLDVERQSALRLHIASIEDETYTQDDFMRVVLASRYGKQYEVSASNAISVLHLFKVKFSGKNLSGIRIPRAELEGVNLESTNLENADLREVNLENAWLNRANLKLARLEGIRLREYPVLSSLFAIRNCRFSRNQNFIVYSYANIIVMIDVITLQRLRKFKEHKSSVNCIDISADGKYIASCSGTDTDPKDCSIRVWHADGGQYRYVKSHQGPIYAVIFHPNSTLVFSSGAGTDIQAFNILDGVITYSLRGHHLRISELKITDDGMLLASSGGNSPIQLWDLEQKNRVSTISDDARSRNVMALDSAHRKVATGSQDGSVAVWRVGDSKASRKFKAHQQSVNCMVFAPDGGRLITGGRDTTIKVWNLQNYSMVFKIIGHKRSIRSLDISPDGATLMSSAGKIGLIPGVDVDNRDLRLWDLEHSAQRGAVSSKNRGYISALVVNPDGKSVFATCNGYANRVTSWELRTGRVINKRELANDEISCMSFMQDRETIICNGGKYGMSLKYIDPNSFMFHDLQPLSMGDISAIKVCLKNGMIAIASKDKILVLSSGKNTELIGHLGNISALCFTESGDRLVSASADKSVKVWDTVAGSVLATLTGHLDGLTDVVISRDGTKIASCSGDSFRGKDYSVKIWHPGESLLPDTLAEHDNVVTSIDFLNNDFWLVSGNFNGGFMVHDVVSKATLFYLALPFAVVEILCYHDYLFIGGNTGIVGCWQKKNDEIVFQWTSDQDTFTCDECNIEGAEIAPVQLELFKQKRATSSQVDISANLYRKKIIALPAVDLGLELRRASAGAFEISDACYALLVERAVHLHVHANCSSNGNTPLHWALLRKNFGKVMIYLQQVSKFNANGYQLLTLKNKNDTEVQKLIIESIHEFPDSIKSCLMDIVENYECDLIESREVGSYAKKMLAKK